MKGNPQIFLHGASKPGKDTVMTLALTIMMTPWKLQYTR